MKLILILLAIVGTCVCGYVKADLSYAVYSECYQCNSNHWYNSCTDDSGFGFITNLNSSTVIPTGNSITSINVTMYGVSRRYTQSGYLSLYLNNFLLQATFVTFTRACLNFTACPYPIHFTVSPIPDEAWNVGSTNQIKLVDDNSTSICLSSISMTFFYDVPTTSTSGTTSTTSSTSGTTSTTSTLSTAATSSTIDTTSSTSTFGAVTTSSSSTTTSGTTSSSTSTSGNNTIPSSGSSNLNNDSSKSNSSGLSSGGAAGVSIAVILVVGLAAVFLFIWLKRRQNKKQATPEVPLQSVSTDPSPPPQTSSVPIVTEIKDVEVKVRLGGGNFGDVYQGVWQKSSSVALKKLKSETEMNEFMSEATLLQSLNHPHIVRFFGIYSNSEKERFIATELMDEGSLLSFISKNKATLTAHDLLDFSVQAAAGMKYIEANKVIHRDLALRNLLISKTSNGYCVKVGDLGLGRSLENSYYSTNGKPIPIKWSAPEVVLEGKFTIKSDVWSFGVVLWEIFSYGKLPYPAFSNEEVIKRIEKGYRMPKPENMPEQVATLMLDCWEEDPDKRPSFDELFNSLSDIDLVGHEEKKVEYSTEDTYGITPVY